jgi:hypothetical protein
MIRRRLEIKRNKQGVSEAQLVTALLATTALPADQATALARAVVQPPAHIEWAVDSSFPVEQVAEVLIEQGFEVAFDA